MELKRRIYDRLLEWKNQRQGRTALLIEGARRIGKSHIAERFGREEYKSFLLVDFSRITRQVLAIFEEDIMDLDVFFLKLSTAYGVPLHPRESLIVFDEVQMYPPARQLIKHLVADGRYDYIETGSLITLKKNVENIVIPSEEERLSMQPLDFEEFLWAMGDTMTMPYVRRCFEKRVPLGQALHRKVMTAFRTYMIVGGMPQVVLSYLDKRDFSETDQVKRQILSLYRTDVTKFASGYESRVNAIFDSIPSQLSRHEKKFGIASLNKSLRFRDYEDAFMWLSDAKIINLCFSASDPNVALALSQDRNTLKCYMADTGLLVAMALNSGIATSHDLYRALLLDRLHVNEGMFMENMVAQLLKSSGRDLYFYSSYDKVDSTSRMEVDFLIVRDRRVCPIEVKSGARLTHASLDKFSEKFKKNLGERFLLSDRDVMTKDGITFLPIYMAGLL
jgi:predicted AAA+ superfamily ATPase